MGPLRGRALRALRRRPRAWSPGLLPPRAPRPGTSPPRRGWRGKRGGAPEAFCNRGRRGRKKALEDGIDGIAVAALHPNRRFPDDFIEVEKPGDDVFGRSLSGDDLDQRVPLRGEEVVDDRRPARISKLLEDALGLEMRGVRGQDGIPRRQVLELREDAPFHFEVFGRGFDREIRILERPIILGEGHVRLHRRPLFWGEYS